MNEQELIRNEFRWIAIVAAVTAAIFAAILFASLTLGINPPSNVETIDPQTLHLSGEFTEGNLGTRVDADGRVTTRIVTAQFAFVPDCVVVPFGRPVTLRLSSPDVIHGVLVTGTNVNTMVVPGYISQVHTEFRRTGDLLAPCHEFCGLGHSQMWAIVRVVPADQFKPDANGKVTCEKP